MIKFPALKASTAALAVAAVGFGVTGCGSSSTAAGVVTAPSAGATTEAVTATVAPTTTAPTTSTVPTPATGPLSKEPTAARSSAPAPAKLEKKLLVTGTGPAIKTGDEITVNYYGYNYATGKAFSGGSSWTSATTATPYGPFQVGEGVVIKGWDEGLVGVKAGSRVQLTIPPSLAYPKGSKSPLANDTLVFVIDVLKVGG